ncbi:MAG: nucleotide-binding protein [Bacilli bacterium]|jgi:predicted nucleotide-binding protein|nr:nucleotide-binding protein [Bacilli bacterium]
MYYHVVAQKKSESKDYSSHSLYRYDLLEDQLIEEVLEPKLKGEDFTIDGYSLNSNNLERFKIVESEDKIQNIVDRVQDEYTRSNILAIITPAEIVESRGYVKDVTNSLVEKVKNTFQSTHCSLHENPKTGCKKIFIAYGHDHGRLAEVENLINKLGLEPVALLEQPNKGETIIEKFEENASQVCFAIVLYTKCDCGYPQDQPNSSKPRARQNVVFEHGYLMAKLGRDRVCALVEDSTIETPSDISGVLYVQMSNELWKYQVANEMKAVGIPADLNHI